MTRSLLVALGGPAVLSVALVIYDAWFLCCVETGRSWDPAGEWKGFLDDIGVVNSQLAHLLLILTIAVSLIGPKTITEMERRHSTVWETPLPAFFVAILIGCISLLFFPVPYTNKALHAAQARWFASVIAEQIAVAFTVSAVIHTFVFFTRGRRHRRDTSLEKRKRPRRQAAASVK